MPERTLLDTMRDEVRRGRGRTPPSEIECRFCGLPIFWWHPDSHVNGRWRHVEGGVRCDLRATPNDGSGAIDGSDEPFAREATASAGVSAGESRPAPNGV